MNFDAPFIIYTGKFRGKAHRKCNFGYQESRVLNIIMHNLSGYDSHLFIKALATEIKGDLTIIPTNSECYISFTKRVNKKPVGFFKEQRIQLKFIDSFRFMSASLSYLSSLLRGDEKIILRKEFEKDNYSAEQMEMLERKGVFPYDYVDSYDRLSEIALPSKEQFYNRLNDEHISTEDYTFACDVWEKFQIKTIEEYSNLYMKTDILLLADVFENFRNICHEIYKLDPAHYYTIPGFSWDAMLKYTKVKIELLTDIDMLLFVERGCRGGEYSLCNEKEKKLH